MIMKNMIIPGIVFTTTLIQCIFHTITTTSAFATSHYNGNNRMIRTPQRCCDVSTSTSFSSIDFKSATLSTFCMVKNCNINPTEGSHTHQQIESRENPIGAQVRHSTVTMALIATIALSTFGSPSTVNAYDDNDYASDTVRNVIEQLQRNNGNIEGTVRTYEEIAAIITEGKGVGGAVNFQGIQLERGYVSDEDTTIYNPGLSLLTESEKERLVDAVVQSKKQFLSDSMQQQSSDSDSTSTNNVWSVDAQAGYDFLRVRLDPLHMYELKGYLRIVPIYAAVLYVAVLAVQQLARDIFPPAYLIAVGAIFVPAIVLISFGPQ